MGDFVSFEVYGKSEIGLVRGNNEDRILIDASLGLFLVCDGMGGQEHGEIAAELAAAAIRFYVDSSQDRLDVSWPFGYNFDLSVDANRIVTAIKLANRQVWRKAEQNLECSGMGTTVAAILLKGEDIVGATVGDSRIYLFRKGKLTQISIDDTLVASFVQKGMLSTTEAASHPMRNVLTQAAGSQESVEAHLYEERLEYGDTLLLCSDGLYGPVDDQKICAILDTPDTVERVADRLVAAAEEAGAPDNVSIILLRYT